MRDCFFAGGEGLQANKEQVENDFSEFVRVDNPRAAELG